MSYEKTGLGAEGTISNCPAGFVQATRDVTDSRTGILRTMTYCRPALLCNSYPCPTNQRREVATSSLNARRNVEIGYESRGCTSVTCHWDTQAPTGRSRSTYCCPQNVDQTKPQSSRKIGDQCNESGITGIIGNTERAFYNVPRPGCKETGKWYGNDYREVCCPSERALWEVEEKTEITRRLANKTATPAGSSCGTGGVTKGHRVYSCPPNMSCQAELRMPTGCVATGRWYDEYTSEYCCPQPVGTSLDPETPPLLVTPPPPETIAPTLSVYAELVSWVMMNPLFLLAAGAAGVGLIWWLRKGKISKNPVPWHIKSDRPDDIFGDVFVGETPIGSIMKSTFTEPVWRADDSRNRIVKCGLPSAEDAAVAVYAAWLKKSG